jgi:peptidoglycan/LPS O-acetylase OafA/YrhL
MGLPVALTSLRFFAAMAVLLHHSGAGRLRSAGEAARPLANILDNGYVGVTFFFVLSGFILHAVYADRLQSEGSRRPYFAARAARILPVYFLALALAAVVAWQPAPGAWAQLFLLQSWLPGLPNWNFPAWTLSAELFFYLCFPLLAGRATRLPLHALWPITAGIAAGVLLLSTSATNPWQAPHGWMDGVPAPLLRLPEFVLGIGLAELARRDRLSSLRLPPILAVLALLIVMAQPPATWIAPAATILSALLIVSVVNGRDGAVARVLSTPSLVLLGGASYAIYLLAVPVRAMFEHAGLVSTPALLCYPLVLLAGGLAAFLAVEKPAQRWLRHVLGGRRHPGPSGGRQAPAPR